MRCAEQSFDVLQRPVSVDEVGVKLSFCPGKATWYPEMGRLFRDCRVALETGILPREGTLEDQDASFSEVFPIFIERWRERTYHRIWGDVKTFTTSVLEAVLGKKGGGSRAPRR